MKFIPCLSLFLCIHFTLRAQQDFTPGYIIKLSGDTLKGLIKSVGDADLNESVSFKIEINGEWTQYGYSDLYGFGVGNETFRSIRFLNPSKGNTKDTTFAKQLVSGAYNLFTYMDNARRFFLLQKDTSIYLLYDVQFSSTGEIEQSANYQNALYFISIPCDKLKNKYKRVGYDEKSISDFVQETNNCISGGSSVSYYKKEKVTVTPMIFVGGLPVTPQESQITANFTVRLTLSHVDKHVSLNIGLNYSSTDNMTVQGKDLNPLYRYYTQEQITSIPITVQYNFSQSWIQPYIYLGVAANYNTEDNLAVGYWVMPNEKGFAAGPVAGCGIEARIAAGLFLKADWRYELILQYPAIGLSYHF